MKRRTQTGFSLVELLVVVSVIALLATIGTIAATSFARKAKEQKTTATMGLLMNAILVYQENTGMYPSQKTSNKNAYDPLSDNNVFANLKGNSQSMEKLRALPSDSFQNADRLDGNILDAWGNPLYYAQEGGMGGTPALVSGGADGTIGNPGTTAAKDDLYSYRSK